MSLLLPPVGSEAREGLDIEAVAYKRWTTLRDAINSAKRQYAAIAEAGGIVPRWITYLVIRADDNVELVSIGPKGGRKTLWKFGRHYEGARS